MGYRPDGYSDPTYSECGGDLVLAHELDTGVCQPCADAQDPTAVWCDVCEQDHPGGPCCPDDCDGIACGGACQPNEQAERFAFG